MQDFFYSFLSHISTPLVIAIPFRLVKERNRCSEIFCKNCATVDNYCKDVGSCFVSLFLTRPRRIRKFWY